MRSQLAVQMAVRGVGLPGPAKLRRWARAAARGVSPVTIRVVGTPEARRLNRTYRGQDHATNVLSFSYGERGAGDIVLCAPVIRREARHQRKPLEAHFAHLVVHGMLHLRGYDHADARGAATMETLEKGILAKLGYPDPYREAEEPA
jgi:probable rRNA maturation factor